MKRTLSLILALLLMLSLAACGGNKPNTEEKIKTDVAEPLSWDRINTIPIANDSMTEEQLRQICLDFMRLQLTFGWTPSQETTYSTGTSEKTFYPGKVYGGIPFANPIAFGNIYTAAEYCDPDNGVMDLSGGAETIAQFYNQSAASAFWAWARVSNSVKYQFPWAANEANGCLRIGDYTYPDTLTTYKDLPTKDICKSNGMQTMLEAYAQLEPADGIVNYGKDSGHICIITGKPNVVRNEDGTIDEKKSTVTYMDQYSSWTKQTQSNDIAYDIQGSIDLTTSLGALYRNGYLPFTIAELNKEKPVDKAEVSLDHKESSVSVASVGNCNVTSNYAISDVTVTIKNTKGKEVFTKTAIAYSQQQVNFSAPLSIVTEGIDLTKYANGKHTIEISARIGTGEKLVAYSGTLTA